MSEHLPSPEFDRLEGKFTMRQEAALRLACQNYEVEFDPDHYTVWPLDSGVMPGWAEGWLGGQRHANPSYAEPEEPRGHPTIYVGVSPDGEIHT